MALGWTSGKLIGHPLAREHYPCSPISQNHEYSRVYPTSVFISIVLDVFCPRSSGAELRLNPLNPAQLGKDKDALELAPEGELEGRIPAARDQTMLGPAHIRSF